MRGARGAGLAGGVDAGSRAARSRSRSSTSCASSLDMRNAVRAGIACGACDAGESRRGDRSGRPPPSCGSSGDRVVLDRCCRRGRGCAGRRPSSSPCPVRGHHVPCAREHGERARHLVELRARRAERERVVGEDLRGEAEPARPRPRRSSRRAAGTDRPTGCSSRTPARTRA